MYKHVEDTASGCLWQQLATSATAVSFSWSPGQFPFSPFAHLYMFKFVQVAVLRTVAVNVHLFPQTKAGTQQTLRVIGDSRAHPYEKNKQRKTHLVDFARTIRTWDVDWYATHMSYPIFFDPDIGRADRLGEICSWSLNEFHSAVPSSTQWSASDSLALLMLKLCKNVCTARHAYFSRSLQDNLFDPFCIFPDLFSCDISQPLKASSLHCCMLRNSLHSFRYISIDHLEDLINPCIFAA